MIKATILTTEDKETLWYNSWPIRVDFNVHKRDELISWCKKMASRYYRYLSDKGVGKRVMGVEAYIMIQPKDTLHKAMWAADDAKPFGELETTLGSICELPNTDSEGNAGLEFPIDAVGGVNSPFKKVKKKKS